MSEANLSCYIRRENRLHVLVLEGTLDVATTPVATEGMHEYLAKHGPTLIVDTSRLDFIDSKGVGALMTGAKAARDAGGSIFMLDPAVPVRKILEMCGLCTMFPALPAELQAERDVDPAATAPKPRPGAAARPPARPARKAA